MSLSVPVLNGALNPPIPAVQNLNPPAPAAPNHKRFVIIHTTDIPEDDMSNFQNYGKVVSYDFHVENNVVIDNLVFDYLFLDLNDKNARRYYDNADLTNYNVVAYISLVEKFDSYIENLGAQNILSTFPPRFHYKAQYDSALLQTVTDAPSKCLSTFNFLTSFFLALRRRL